MSQQQIAALAQEVAKYIRAQRAHYHGHAAPLTFSSVWSQFFAPVDLERIRIVQPGQVRVPNPPFYAGLEKSGFTDLPAFGTMAAITFDDVVVFHDSLTPQLIFHEMVHVVQYRLLGIDEFARLYVRGYLHGGYVGTPLEVCAYQLEGRFVTGSAGFNVEAEVKSWIDSGAL